MFYSHVNYSVTKIEGTGQDIEKPFYSHVNYSVTKMPRFPARRPFGFTVT